MTTAADVVASGVRELGGETGTIGTVTVGASTTTLILSNLINTTLDDTAYAGDRLIFPDSAAGSQQAMITTWVDQTGTATIVNQTSAPVAGQRYILVRREDYNLKEFLEGLNKACEYSRRTYRYVIPTVPNLTTYPLDKMTWLEGASDVDAVFFSNSPLMLHNEDFSLWYDGMPDGWTLVGSGAGIAQVDTGVRSAYAAQVTAGGGAAAYLEQGIPSALVQWLTRRNAPVYTPMRGSAWGATSASNAARVGIYDGSTTHYSSYMTGDGVPHYPTLSVTPDADMTDFRLRLEVAAGQTATWSFGGLMQNTETAAAAYSIRDQGSQVYNEYRWNFAPRNIGGIPTLELPSWPGNNGQIIVYTRRPYPSITSLSDTVEDKDARALEAGMLVFTLDSNKPGQDRSRIDRILEEERKLWTRFMSKKVDLPVHAPMNQIQIGSA
jgi:hypothetical protein